jgi:hypothetical protein
LSGEHKMAISATGSTKSHSAHTVWAAAQQFRCKPLLSEKLSHQPQRRSGISAALYQHVEDLAFVVNGTPQIHPLPGDADHHFV